MDDGSVGLKFAVLAMHCGEVEGFATTLLAAAGSGKNGATASAVVSMDSRLHCIARATPTYCASHKVKLIDCSFRHDRALGVREWPCATTAAWARVRARTGWAANAVLAPAVEGFPPTQQFPELAESQTLLSALNP